MEESGFNSPLGRIIDDSLNTKQTSGAMVRSIHNGSWNVPVEREAAATSKLDDPQMLSWQIPSSSTIERSSPLQQRTPSPKISRELN